MQELSSYTAVARCRAPGKGRRLGKKQSAESPLIEIYEQVLLADCARLFTVFVQNPCICFEHLQNLLVYQLFSRHYTMD
jgi:hypothetical protein